MNDGEKCNLRKIKDGRQVEQNDGNATAEAMLFSQDGIKTETAKSQLAKTENFDCKETSQTGALQDASKLKENNQDKFINKLRQDKTVRRVWEVDFLRGFCMLFVIWDHLMYDFAYIFYGNFSTAFARAIGNFARAYCTSGIRYATHDWFVGVFVLVSGLSTVFSRNNWIKAGKVLTAAFLLTLITNAGVSYFGRGIVINYGILHMLATCGLIYAFLKTVKAPNWLPLALGAVALAVGYYFNAQNLTEPVGLIFLFNSKRAFGWSAGDFWPLMPWLGWFLIGAFLGSVIYKNKTTKLPFINEKYLAPVTFVGKNSLWFYLLSQAICIALLWLLTTFKWI